MRISQTAGWTRRVLALVLFGSAFGYLEAAVVSYLRYLHAPVLHRFYPGRSINDLFPLLTSDEAGQSGPQERKVLLTEVGREASTIVMLAAVALAVSTSLGQWAAAFAIAFGVWDITFYLFLKVLLDWPTSLFTWDILFIIPVPWVAPVIAPVTVSAAMVLAGIWHLQREAAAHPVSLGVRNWLCLFAGATLIVISFILDRANISAGGMPRPFHWAVFAAGMAVGLGGYTEAALRSRPFYFAAASSPHISGSSPESLRNSL
jgi:hypothetical protein